MYNRTNYCPTKAPSNLPKQLSAAIKLKNLQQLCLYITDFKRHKASCLVDGKKLWKKTRLKASVSDKTSKKPTSMEGKIARGIVYSWYVSYS
jgi:hypothetical protein